MLDLIGLCAQVGVEFYGDELLSENGRKIYRVSIVKKGGVNVDDCVRLSEILSPILDVSPPCAGAYSLEVSSAGLERALKTPRHFALSVGEKVQILLSNKSKIRGEILGVWDENSSLNLRNLGGNSVNLGENLNLMDKNLGENLNFADKNFGLNSNAKIEILLENKEKITLNFSDIKKAKSFVEWD